MATITTINAGDALEPTSRNNINNNFANLNTDKLEAADVTYANLNANGDVGTGATQVAQGNHTHTHSSTTGITANDHHNEDHASRHVDGGADEIDGDTLDVDFTPSNYTPDAGAAEANDVDDLAAHLKGVDDQFGAIGTGGILLDVDLTGVAVVNNSAETAIYSFTLPANTLGTDQGVEVFVPIDNLNMPSGSSVGISLKYGSTQVALDTWSNSTGGTVNGGKGWIKGYIFGNGTTSSQSAWVEMHASANSGGYDASSTTSGHILAVGSGAEDSTAALTLQVTVDWDAATTTRRIHSVRGVAKKLANA